MPSAPFKSGYGEPKTRKRVGIIHSKAVCVWSSLNLYEIVCLLAESRVSSGTSRAVNDNRNHDE